MPVPFTMQKRILGEWHERGEVGLDAIELLGESSDSRGLKLYRLSNGSLSWLPDSVFEVQEAKPEVNSGIYCGNCGVRVI